VIEEKLLFKVYENVMPSSLFHLKDSIITEEELRDTLLRLVIH